MLQSYQIRMPESLYYTNSLFFYTKPGFDRFHSGFGVKAAH